ncbi:bile acid:sodium symporter family protein [Rhodoferax antarcticus]|uniref:bile acid:sodium symporter family protein n=1 Tax=Rhodoferax antarcticus TaxID=81479 RepID=UPI0022243808|nr:bile acid:sodium symporter family protein [Rhodoferax antarcticus]MCW2310645.1 BASS family bile acid:Na+ symporter [Rhodoferax antarcticus]
MNPAIVQKLLPLALAFIMFYLGMTLVLADFRRVAQRPKALLAGLTGQMLVVPLAGFAVATLTGLDPVMAVGLMVLAACPGGVSAGLLTHLARGDTALSISLTAVTSLASMLTLPLIVNASLQHFMGSSLTAQLPLAPMVQSIFLLTTLPVLLGMALRWKFPRMVTRGLPSASKVATSLFVMIVLATFWDQREVLWVRLPTLGPATLLLNAMVLSSVYLLATQVRLHHTDRIAIVTECGLQNSALGIFVCLQLLASPAMSAPSVVYALLMNGGAMVFVLLMRRRRADPALAP